MMLLKLSNMPREMQEKDFEVKASSLPGVGQGLFALSSIQKGETIGRYEGMHLTDEQANNEPYVNSRYLVWVCTDCYIDGSRGGNHTRFINHSKDPNCELITSTRWKTARIRALKDIAPNTELFFDYGDEYWQILEEDWVSLNDE